MSVAQEAASTALKVIAVARFCHIEFELQACLVPTREWSLAVTSLLAIDESKTRACVDGSRPTDPQEPLATPIFVDLLHENFLIAEDIEVMVVPLSELLSTLDGKNLPKNKPNGNVRHTCTCTRTFTLCYFEIHR